MKRALLAAVPAILALISLRPLAGVPEAAAVQGQPAAQPRAQDRFRAPDGFVVETAAAPEKTGSVVAMTFDSRGRPAISVERGPVFILEDNDRDGVFETFLKFQESVKNCQGLYFVGNDLLAVGDGPQGTGLYRVIDRNGDSAADETVLLTRFVGSMGEHGPHSVFFGPDGYHYVTIGNHAGIEPTPDPLSAHRDYYEGHLLPAYADARGHARNVRAPGATIFRIDADARTWTMFAGGFRNHYDSAFDATGELFTFDSDMEWDINLPWYREVRTVHIVSGGEYGCRPGSGNWPDYFIDSLPPMAEQGRGSPVGVEFYLHHVYPEKYRNAFILGDWSRGRILMELLTPSGATYKGRDEEFVTGFPINVTDLEVGPDGFIYFTNGGRNTEGGLYRIAYRGSPPQPPPPSTGVEAALGQPQHRSAWGRARLLEIQRQMGSRWGRELQRVVADAKRKPEARARALELLAVYGPKPALDFLVSLGRDAAWEVRASSTYYLGLDGSARTRKELAARLSDPEPFVRRRAAEALVRVGIDPARDPGFDVRSSLVPLLGDSDRWVRFAAVRALERTNRNLWRQAVLDETRPVPAIEGMLALVQTVQGTNDIEPLLRKGSALLEQDLPADDLLRLLRVLHLAFINDQGVERAQLYQEIGARALALFPHPDWRARRELARTVAHLQTPGAVSKIVAELERPGASQPDQIYWAYCLRVLRSGWEDRTREVMVRWFARTQTEKWRGGASFVGFLELIWGSWRGAQPHDAQVRANELLASLAPPVAAPAGRQATSFTRRNDVGVLSDQELFEYLTWDPMAYRAGAGDDGPKLYQKAQCASCHIYKSLGFEAGPDLSDIGKRFQRKDLVEAIVYPDRAISDLWAAVEITTTDGQKLVGTVVSESETEVVLSQVGGKTTIPAVKIKNRAVSKKSLMPPGLLDNLTLREAVSLLLFLERGG